MMTHRWDRFQPSGVKKGGLSSDALSMNRRWLLTSLALAASLGGYMVMDCASFTITASIDGRGPFVCHGTFTDGALPGAGVAFWAWMASLGLLAGAWLPHLTSGRRTAERAAAALTENLGRVFDEKSGETPSPVSQESADGSAKRDRESSDPRPEHEALLDLVRKELSRLRDLAASGSMPPREWLALLVELNGLHNDGVIPTKSFREINTELLGLVSEPMARAEGHSESNQALAAV